MSLISTNKSTPTVKENVPFEPGAARFGNFINYYTFNSVTERLKVIPKDFIYHLKLAENPVLILDIGCNSGEMTAGLYSHLVCSDKEIFILGIDLDDVLITRCKESNDCINISYEKVDITNNEDDIIFKSFLSKYNRSSFDVITCFSTTMWIHLNHGDSGLNDFLQKVSKLGKFLLFEPQEWKSYKSAIRRMTRLKQDVFNLDELQNRDIVKNLCHYLLFECNMDSKRCLGRTSWGRSLFLFERIDIS